MLESEVRNWLGKYFLGSTILYGAYFLLFAETPLLPLSRPDANASFAIIFPVFLGQLMMIFRWYGANIEPANDRAVGIPTWVVKWPPVLVFALLLITSLLMILTNIGQGKGYAPSPDTFIKVVTISMSILNATTIIVIGRLFDMSKSAH